MPDPPDVNLVTRYVLENPWPLGAILLLVGAWLAWSGLRDGQGGRVKIAVGSMLLGAIVLATGAMITTSGERAKGITEALVNAAVNKNTAAARALFSQDAVMAVGSPKNPGFDIDFIAGQLDRLASRYTIESNSITSMRGFSESANDAMVHLACWTTVQGGYGPTPSQWVLRVRRQSDGSWKIAHLTCVSINNQTPPLGEIW